MKLQIFLGKAGSFRGVCVCVIDLMEYKYVIYKHFGYTHISYTFVSHFFFI